MGVGDPWDTSYNPKHKLKKNRASGKISWGPDLSDEYSWEEKEDYKGYGRFCAEGCGCINTGCDNGFTGAQCVLPNELTVTLVKDEHGRVSARGGLESRGDVWHLKYSNGAWRGRKCCTSNGDMSITGDAENRVELSPRLNYGPPNKATGKHTPTEGAKLPHGDDALSLGMLVPPLCDPCKVTTLPNGLESTCSYKHNKYPRSQEFKPDEKNVSKREASEKEPTLGGWSYDKAIEGKGSWPRQGEELYLTSPEWGANVSIDSITDVDFKVIPAVKDEEGNTVTPAKVVVTDTDKTRHGMGRMGFNIVSRYGDSSLVAHNEEGDFNGRSGQATSEVWNVYTDPRHKYETNYITQCVPDGLTPVRKIPYCQNVLDKKEVKGVRNGKTSFCTRNIKYTHEYAHCVKRGTTEATDDRKKACDASDDHKWLSIDDIIAECQRGYDDEDGKVRSVWLGHQAGCEQRGSCKSFDGDGAVIGDIDNYKDCKVDNKDNHFLAHQWVTWEHEPHSCCGGLMIGEDHPSHTPQVSGGGQQTRKNHTCFTPYRELVLSPQAQTGTVAPLTQGGCKAIQNQEERVTLFADFESYWTIVLRDCGYWNPCFNDEGKANKALYGPNKMGCGEELVLYLPIDQFVNCSNFNLTLGGDNPNMSGWSEIGPRWVDKMGDYFGNPAGFFPGSPEKSGPKDWCGDFSGAGPSTMLNGIANRGGNLNDDNCQQYVYFESGAHFAHIGNPRGHIKLRGLNLRPQPFKATEKIQNSAKAYYQAYNDQKYWEMCIGTPGTGKSFMNMGYEFWFENDFVRWDEVGTTKGASVGYIVPGGVCEDVNKKIRKWVDSHKGGFRAGHCGDAQQGPRWNAWDYSMGAQKGCPQCDESGTEGECNEAAKCTDKDGAITETTNSPAGKSACEDAGGEFNACCEWSEECDRDITVNYKESQEPEACREVRGDGDCTCVVDDNQGNVTVEKSRKAKDNCEPTHEGGWNKCVWVGEFIDVDQIIDDLVDPVEIPDANVICQNKDGAYGEHRGEFSTIDALDRPANDEEECVKSTDDGGAGGTWFEGCSPIALDEQNCANSALVPQGLIDIALDDRLVVPNKVQETNSGYPSGNSLEYWTKTGLYPKGELASFVNNQCVGVGRYSSIQDASNSQPITITSRKHRLREGDKVWPFGIMGNFSANVLTTRDWMETQWESKKYKKCIKNCDKTIWPQAVCPYNMDGTCPEKFLGCDGTVVLGKQPPPASFFVIKNVTPDTFDLFTCDGKPIDGRINRFDNMPELERLGCDLGNPSCLMGIFEQKIDAQKYELTINGKPWKEATSADIDAAGPHPILTEIPEICVDATSWKEIKKDGKRLSSEDVNNPDVCQVDNPDTDIKDDGPHKKISGGITFADNPETEGTIEGGGEKVCKRYGQCLSMKGAYGSEEATHSLSKEDCIELTKTYTEYDPEKGKNSKKTKHCYRDDSVCLDDDGNTLDANSYETCSVDPVNGNWNEKFTIVDKDENSCKGLPKHVWVADAYGECVDDTGDGVPPDDAFDNCFHEHQWGIPLSDESGGTSFSNWKVCPHTGDFMIYQEDVGIEAGYVSHLSDQELVDLYKDGWDTAGFKDEDKANHWYAQIEQKGTCPVCCDHFLPHSLTATVTSMPTEWLNLASCGTDPCSPSLTNVIGDGYCCGDGCHACNLGDIPHCEEDPSSYGDCTVEGRKVMIFTKKGCEDKKGSFTPVGKSEDCDMWARLRHNTGGLKNCRRCSQVYRDTTPGMGTFEAKLKSGANFPEYQDLDGGDCCPNCECFINDQDKSRFGCTNISYLECSQVVECIGDCTEANAGEVQNVGHVKATCKRYVDPNCATADKDCPLKYTSNDCAGSDCCQWSEGGVEKCCKKLDGAADCGTMCRDGDGNRITSNGNAIFDEPTCTEKGGTLKSGETGDDYQTCEYEEGSTEPGTGTGIWVTGECIEKTTSGTYRWSMDPCTCFPDSVPHSCQGDGALCGDKDASCSHDGKAYGPVGECINHTAGCRDEDGNDVPTGDPPTDGTRKDGAKEEDCVSPNEWYPGGKGCGSRSISADSDVGCYDLCASYQEGGADLNCPGFGSIDLALEYNGVMWHSDWTLMGTVGTHQCHKYKHTPNCTEDSWACVNPSGYVSRERLAAKGECEEETDPVAYVKCQKDACPEVMFEGIPSKIVESSDTKPAVNSDCNGCSHASWDGFSGEVEEPSTSKGDGFYMRGVLGCGSSVPGYEGAGGGGYQPNGGLNVGDYYRNNQMHLYLEITNCSYWDHMEALNQPPGGFTMAGPPIYPDGRKGPGCWSAKKVNEEFASKPITGERHKYAAALPRPGGATVTEPVDCIAMDGAFSPCTECCEYRGPSFAAEANKIHGAVLCSTGGDVAHDCKSTGFEILPTKPAERFNVVYVKDLQEDGSATLVVNSHPPTFGGLHCAYPAGTPVSIGMADKFEAETRGNFSWVGGSGKTKNRHSANPNLPTPATTLTEGIASGNPTWKSARGLGPYMEIKVADVSRLISKNQRYRRNLKDWDRQGDGPLKDMDGLQPKNLPSPYGISPWPVDTMVDNRGGMFPGGGPQHPRTVESLAWDALGVSTSPGRSGPHQTAELLNKYNEMDEVDMGGGMTTPIPKHDIRKLAGIKTYDNVYAEPNGKDGYCLNPAYTYKGAEACTNAGSKWVPDFLFTKITTFQDHDLNDGEKIHISGSIMYKATCKGVVLGQCWSLENIKDLTSYKTEQECILGKCIDLKTGQVARQGGDEVTDEMTCSTLGGMDDGDTTDEGLDKHPGYEFRPNGQWLEFASDDILDEYLCEEILEGEWVIGIRSDGEQDPFNKEPTKIATGDFEQGCPLGCRINGFFLKDACEPPSETVPQGQCTECFEVESISAGTGGDKSVKKEMKCPYHEIDDMHMSRIRGCQNSLFTDKDTCRDKGWDWYDDHHPLLKSNEFALHSELTFDIYDSAQLRTVVKGSGRAGRIGFDTLDPDADVYPFQACSTVKHYTACDNDPDCYFYALDGKGAGKSSSGVCVYLKSATVTSLQSISIADMHDYGIPWYGQNQGQEPNLQKRLCDESSNCAYVMPFDKCLDDTRVAIGECICPDGNSTQTKRSLCQGTCAWIPPTIEASTERQCLEADGKIQHQFVCAMDDQGTIKAAQTPRHCQVLGGTSIWDGVPTGIRLPEERTNVQTTPERLYTLSSGEAIKLGGDGFIGIPSNKFRGVIAAGSAKAAATRVQYCFGEGGGILDVKDSKECGEKEGTWRDEAFDKYADYMPYWSRHAGSFDIIVGYPEPLDNCAQGNSNTPVNMEFWSTFHPKCCNSRGPLTAHQCGERCYDNYLGPYASSLDYDYQEDVGNAIFRINIHE